jgi:hypothetical protein
LFSAEVDSELKSIVSILGDTTASGVWSESAVPCREEFAAPRPDAGRSPVNAAPAVETRRQTRPDAREDFTVSPVRDALEGSTPSDARQESRTSDALKGHDRIAALKVRLAEKLRGEGERPPKENPRGDVAFARCEEDAS